ncbi:hypothetical protein [Rossellomorea sp. DUT-2]|uniref:hypothetical protein n=1 Tax=Rossellomorea sp. DUT-2 TaxID=3412021 RepID=UPI003D16E655
MYFYCESKNDSDYAVLDVNKLINLENLWERNKVGFWNTSDKRSMILVKGLKTIKYRGFRAGKWYDLPDNLWESFSFYPEEFSYEKKNPSMIFRLLIIYKGTEDLDFAQFRVDEETLINETFNSKDSKRFR